MNARVVDDLTVNMVDVGEETGELDTMLYKVADTFDEEVAVLTESLTSLDGAAADHLPGRRRRLHRHRPVLAADQTDPILEPLTPRGTRKEGAIMNSRKRSLAGFSLVEMLVVIAIISILAGLIGLAVPMAVFRAKQARIKSEVDQLDMAMKAFKDKYGAFPPMDLTLPSGNPLNNPNLLTFIQQAFPRYNALGINPLTNKMNIVSDWIVLNVDMTYVHPDRALVFWLSGFSPDVTSPFCGVGTRTPLFNFDPARLYNMTLVNIGGFTSPTYSPAQYSTNMTVSPYTSQQQLGNFAYVAQGGNYAPYFYVDAPNYGTSISTPNSWTFNSTTPVYSNAMSTQQMTIGTLSCYVLDVNNNNIFDTAIDTFCNPTSFQIICPGQDGQLGTPNSTTTVSPAYVRFYPGGYNYDRTGADFDNVTNFLGEKSSLQDAMPN